MTPSTSRGYSEGVWVFLVFPIKTHSCHGLESLCLVDNIVMNLHAILGRTTTNRNHRWSCWGFLCNELQAVSKNLRRTK